MEDAEIGIYADDNTPHIRAENIDKLISSLEEASNTPFKWFADNLLKTNADKCDLLVSGTQKANSKIENFCISSSESEKVLGIKFDCQLTFNEHITDLCKKASRKLNTLARISPYITITKRQILMRCLPIMCNDKKSLFQQLLEKDGCQELT